MGIEVTDVCMSCDACGDCGGPTNVCDSECDCLCVSATGALREAKIYELL